MLAEVSFEGYPFPVDARASVSPVPLANLAFWLDAGRGIALDGGSARVARWSSRSGATEAAQTTTAAMPVLVGAALNGLPGVRLDGADDWLSVPMPAGTAAECAILLVASGFTGASFQTVVSSEGQWRLQTNDVEFASGGGFSYSAPVGARVVEARFSGGYGPAQIAFDGAVAGSGVGSVGAPTAVALGKNVSAGGADYGAVTFHEVLYYAASLPPDDAATVRTYLAQKWGLA